MKLYNLKIISGLGGLVTRARDRRGYNLFLKIFFLLNYRLSSCIQFLRLCIIGAFFKIEVLIFVCKTKYFFKSALKSILFAF